MTLSHRALVSAIESRDVSVPPQLEDEWISAVDRFDDFAAALVLSIAPQGEWSWQIHVFHKRAEKWEELAAQGAYGDHWTHETAQAEFENVVVTTNPLGDETQLVSISGTAPFGTRHVTIQDTNRSASTYGPFCQFVILLQSTLQQLNLVARGTAGEHLGRCAIEI